MTGAVVGGNEQSNGSENRGVHVDERAAGGEERVWNGDLDERDVNAASCDILNREVKEPKSQESASYNLAFPDHSPPGPTLFI